MLRALKSINSAAADVKQSLDMFCQYRIIKNCLVSWAEAIEIIKIKKIKMQIAGTFRKKILLDHLRKSINKGLLEKEKIKQIEAKVNSRIVSDKFDLWAKYKEIALNAKKIIKIFQ